MTQATHTRRAAVIGASMAGLMAARVLSLHFDEVVLLERDELPEGAQPRKGTPHAVQPHGLLARGRKVIEALFPGFTEALVAQGAVTGDAGTEVLLEADRRRFATEPLDEPGVGASRLAIEAELRRRVRALRRVRFCCSVDVIEPVHDAKAQRVVGVRIAQRRENAQPTVLLADLVVDCSGRASRSPQWLSAWGYGRPEEERIKIDIAYASAYFERNADAPLDAAAIVCTATPTLQRPAVLIAQEPDAQGRARWVVGVGGYGREQPEGSRESLAVYARHLGSPEILALAERGAIIGGVQRYAFPHSQRRLYERMRRFPAGYLVLGDAIASFNPIYGQGMTVAACEAQALQTELQRGTAGLQRRFFRAAAKTIDIPWQLAAGADLALPLVPGPRPLPVRIVNAYIGRVFRAAVHDAKVATAFRRVMHLLAAPPSLFAPGIVWRVWRHGAAAPLPSPGRPRMPSEAAPPLQAHRS